MSKRSNIREEHFSLTKGLHTKCYRFVRPCSPYMSSTPALYLVILNWQELNPRHPLHIHPSLPPIQTYLSVHSFFHASIKYYIFLFYFLLTHFLDCTHQKIDFEKMKKNCPNNFLDFFHVYQALHNTTQHNMIFTRLPPKVFSYWIHDFKSHIINLLYR